MSQSPASPALLISGVTLIDGTDAAPREGTSVLVEDGRVQRIGFEMIGHARDRDWLHAKAGQISAEQIHAAETSPDSLWLSSSEEDRIMPSRGSRRAMKRPAPPMRRA